MKRLTDAVGVFPTGPPSSESGASFRPITQGFRVVRLRGVLRVAAPASPTVPVDLAHDDCAHGWRSPMPDEASSIGPGPGASGAPSFHQAGGGVTSGSFQSSNAERQGAK